MQKKVDAAAGAQFVRYFGPVLDALRELGSSGAPSEVLERIVENLKISESVQGELLDSGNPRFPNQVAWARYYLTREGLIDSSKRGVWSLTEKGLSTHLTYQEGHAIFRKWVKFFAEARKKRKVEPSTEQGDESPPERLNLRRQIFAIGLRRPYFHSRPPDSKDFANVCYESLDLFKWW